jgi:ferritin-like metal-binding protein YciE
MTATIQEQLVKYIADAHALEQHVNAVLASALRMTDVPELVGPLQHHKEETERHKALLEERLEAHGASPSKVKDAGMAIGALALGMFQRVRSDSVGKLARDAFVAEHLEIAAYEMLERVASRAGDTETAEVARRNRADEQAMAEKIASLWDLAVDLSLKEEGVEGAPPIPPPKGEAAM